MDVADLASAFSQASAIKDRGVFPQYIGPQTKIIHIGIWDLLQHSWATDYKRLYPVDVPITGDTRLALPMLVDFCRQAISRAAGGDTKTSDRRSAIEAIRTQAREHRAAPRSSDARPISAARLSAEIWQAVKGKPWVGSARSGWEVTDPEQVPSAGSGGGSAGLGLAMGAAIGTALAYKGSGRFSIHLTGDGEFLYTPSSLWTLSNLNLPVLTVINDNRLYGNDEGHQEHMARVRGRNIENKIIGITLDRPATDFAGLARAFGIEGFGLIEDVSELRDVLEAAVRIVMNEQRPVVVDVLTASE